ncbi:MAG: hypothetical protein VW930_07730 [Burkholderiaceae bacterium]
MAISTPTQTKTARPVRHTICVTVTETLEVDVVTSADVTEKQLSVALEQSTPQEGKTANLQEFLEQCDIKSDVESIRFAGYEEVTVDQFESEEIEEDYEGLND